MELKLPNKDKIIKNALELIEESKVAFKPQVRALIEEYSTGQYSFHTFKSQLNGFQDLEFYLKLKPSELISLSFEEMAESFYDKQLKKQFLRKYASIFNIIVVLLNYLSNNHDHVNQERVIIIEKMYLKLRTLRLDLNKRTIEMQDYIKVDVELSWLYLIKSFNIYVSFIRELFFKYLDKGEDEQFTPTL